MSARALLLVTVDMNADSQRGQLPISDSSAISTAQQIVHSMGLDASPAATPVAALWRVVSVASEELTGVFAGDCDEFFSWTGLWHRLCIAAKSFLRSTHYHAFVACAEEPDDARAWAPIGQLVLLEPEAVPLA